ncbi:MAG: lasso peptide biosynthesis B2 protein [Candidatus Polarisedimenticolaceae bacterium]|nr:lasso peptide biosynthesis B2 protein [Candidatus Polarisedimenticolaceae bacterium]
MLAEAWLTLTWVDFVVSFLPYRWWKSWLLTQPEAKTNQTASFEHLVWSVNAAANHHLRKPTCLRRSLTLKHMLQRQNISAILRIGIKRNGVEVDAHAWIEYNDFVLNDSTDIVASYSQFPILSTESLQGFQGL